jgi:hypothetical protein
LCLEGGGGGEKMELKFYSISGDEKLCDCGFERRSENMTTHKMRKLALSSDRINRMLKTSLKAHIQIMNEKCFHEGFKCFHCAFTRIKWMSWDEKLLFKTRTVKNALNCAILPLSTLN